MEKAKRKTILIVDDEQSIRQLIRETIAERYSVLEAIDGEEALTIARRDKPDLVLMDLLMPKMDGYTSCHKIKADLETKGIPVIMLTCIDYDLNLKLAREIGADGYMTKPVSPRDLLEAIGKMLSNS